MLYEVITVRGHGLPDESLVVPAETQVAGGYYADHAALGIQNGEPAADEEPEVEEPSYNFV